MKNLLNRGDLSDAFYKIRERGVRFFAGKIGSPEMRTRTTFDDTVHINNGIWIIPAVMKRWNHIISGNENMEYEDYLISGILDRKKNLKMLSPGCGAGNHEIRFAASGIFNEIIGIDLATRLMDEANKKAREKGLTNIAFRSDNMHHISFPENYFDIIHFHQSLHHFKNMERFIPFIKRFLKKDGILIIFEYTGPNRFQFPKEQIEKINQLLVEIPANYKRKYATNAVKKRVYSPGMLRMILSDPSEAVDSFGILPAIHKHFETIEEKTLGGNLLMLLFKDIAHHFIHPEDSIATSILEKVFKEEDEYLKDHPSDFMFGIYKKS